MSPQTFRMLIAGALFVHGIGHSLGFWKPAHSIPFVKITDKQIKIAGGIVWAVVAVGFVISAMSFFGMLFPSLLWRPLAVIFAVISLIGLFLFGRSWPIFNFIGAGTFNIVVLVALVWLNWLPA